MKMTEKKKKIGFWVLLAALGLVLSCKGNSTPSALAADEVKLSSEQMQTAESMLAAYEDLRTALAADKLGDAPKLAEQLVKQINALKNAGPATIAKILTEIHKRASALKPNDKPDDIRRAFGGLSREVISLLVQIPSLKKGRHIFKCPMAQGYQKWIQSSDKLENPYMGQKMLRCGGESQWAL